MLGKKHITKHEDWLRAWDSCTDIYSKDYIDSLTEKTIQRLYNTIDKFDIDTSRMGYGWSGGKDSVVLGDILSKTKYNKDLRGYCSIYPLYYDAFLKYIEKNKPSNVETFLNDRIDEKFINENPKYLFNSDESMYLREWSTLSRYVENKFYKNNDLSMNIVGRRTLDGNCIRKTDNLPIQFTKDKNIYAMIYDWKHEELFAYIKYNNLKLCDMYFYKDGFRYGTRLWVERDPLGSLKENLDEIWNLDKNTIINSAKKGLIVSQNYLKEINYNGYTKN